MGTTCTLHACACTRAHFFVRWTLTLRSLYVRRDGIFIIIVIIAAGITVLIVFLVVIIIIIIVLAAVVDT